jgi:hypothetical protein
MRFMSELLPTPLSPKSTTLRGRLSYPYRGINHLLTDVTVHEPVVDLYSIHLRGLADDRNSQSSFAVGIRL